MTNTLTHRRHIAQQAAATPMAATDLGTVHFTEPGKLDLEAYRGDSGRFRVNVTDPGGSPLNVSTATWDCDVRVTADDPAVVTSLTVTPVSGTPSAVDVILTTAQSALLPAKAVWDLQMTLGGEVTTLLAGDFTTTLDVSRTGSLLFR